MRPLMPLLVAVVVMLAGCGPKSGESDESLPPLPNVRFEHLLTGICQMTARQLNVEPSRVTSETSLADLDADELDLVELVLEIDESYEIQISDEMIEELTGMQLTSADFLSRVTMHKLATKVDQLLEIKSQEKSAGQ